MEADRIFLETDASGNVIGMPKLPPNKQFEAIFLVVADKNKNAPPRRRTPPPQLKGSVAVFRDPFEPAISDAEWDASIERTARQISGDPEAFE